MYALDIKLQTAKHAACSFIPVCDGKCLPLTDSKGKRSHDGFSR